MKKYLFVAVFILIHIRGFTQSISPAVIASGGMYGDQGGLSLSYTFGQPSLVETFQFSSDILTQGFQQPDTIRMVYTTGVGENTIEVSVMIFPNPVSSLLSCKIENGGNYQFTIYDMTGRTMLDPIRSADHLVTLDVHSLAQGAYVLSIADEQNHPLFTSKFIRQ